MAKYGAKKGSQVRWHRMGQEGGPVYGELPHVLQYYCVRGAVELPGLKHWAILSPLSSPIGLHRSAPVHWYILKHNY